MHYLRLETKVRLEIRLCVFCLQIHARAKGIMNDGPSDVYKIFRSSNNLTLKPVRPITIKTLILTNCYLSKLVH